MKGPSTHINLDFYFTFKNGSKLLINSQGTGVKKGDSELGEVLRKGRAAELAGCVPFFSPRHCILLKETDCHEQGADFCQLCMDSWTRGTKGEVSPLIRIFM